MVDKQDDKDASKKPKKQKGGGGKHKQKCQGHFFKCQQNKDRHVEKSSHGAFNSVADMRAKPPKYAAGWVSTKAHPKGWKNTDKVAL